MRRRIDPGDLLIGLMFLAATFSVCGGMVSDGCRAVQRDDDQRSCRERGGTVDYFDAKHAENWRCLGAHSEAP